MSRIRALFARSAKGEAIRVDSIGAARCVYQGPEVKERVEVKVQADGETLILDMNSKQTLDLIMQLTAAYNTINPPLRPDMRGAY